MTYRLSFQKSSIETSKPAPNCDAKLYDTGKRFLHRLVPPPAVPGSPDRSIALVIGYLARMCSVQEDEVAILVLDRKGENLWFAAPEYLTRIKGKFPFNRLSSVAGRSLCDRRPIVENQMTLVNHLAYFEQVRRKNMGPSRIEKMLTYPVVIGGSPLGVVQISRKATIQQPSQPSFFPSDVRNISDIDVVLVRLIQRIRESMFSH